jgi:hypothetical protein
MRGRIGSFLITVGWLSYSAALFCPAVDCELGVLTGAECIWETIGLTNLFFPGLVILSLLLNGAMLLSPLLIRINADGRCMAGSGLLFLSLIALASPFWAPEVRSLLVGWWLWAFSFAAVGGGFLFLAESSSLSG